MPPRYAYWTIIVDNQPTAFRSGSQEELMPTFKRLKAKNDTAVMMWFQNGKLWQSRVEAQEAMLARGAMGRRGDERQPGFRDRTFKPSKPRDPKTRESRTAWTPRGEPSTPAPKRNADEKLDWKPKGEFVPAPKRADRAEWKPRDEKPAWKPKSSEKPDWKPKGSTFAKATADRSFDRESKPDWKPKSDWKSKPAWKPKSEAEGRGPGRSAEREGRPEWKPKGSFDSDRKPASRSFDREERPRSFKRPDFKSSGDDTRSAKPEWKPKGSFVPAPRRSGGTDWKPKTSKPDWKSKSSSSERPAWKPKGSTFSKGDKPFDRERKPEWKPNRDTGGRFSSSEGARAPRGEKLEWKPKGEGYKPKAPEGFTPSGEKRKWMPKEEYKKSMGIEAKRDSKWRPGGEHKDPKQKYKDAKKAKWSKFKENIRARSGGKGKKPS